MFKLFTRQNKSVTLESNPPYVIDLSCLQTDELLEFRYDEQERLSSVRKLKLLNGLAKAETDIEPNGNGRVLWHGSSWRACCAGVQKIIEGQTVFVLARQDLTLIVAIAN